MVLRAGATATLVCFCWLGGHNRLCEKEGRQKVSNYPAPAHVHSGDGRLGRVRHAGDILVGTAEYRSTSTAFALGSDLPALLRKGARKAPGGQLDFPRDVLALRKQGLTIPRRLNRMGH